jgi:hypothetical protein
MTFAAGANGLNVGLGEATHIQARASVRSAYEWRTNGVQRR